MNAPSYPEIAIRNVAREQVWRLYNAGNYSYFRRMIRDIQTGTCPFCWIDRTLNQEIEINNPSWIVWDNPISRLGGPEAQYFQFVIPLRRHATSHDELTRDESADLFEAVRIIDRMFDIRGGALIARNGNPLQCARSVEHYHVNYHVPTGKKEVRPWLAKDYEGLLKKRQILIVFEKMRVMEEDTSCSMEQAFNSMPQEEKQLVAHLLQKEGRC